MPHAENSGYGQHDTGLYLHVPFCLHKCAYCSFFSVAGRHEMEAQYVQAVQGQIQHMNESGWLEECRVATVFAGGGTPSILPPGILANLLRQFHRRFSLVDGEIETSVEVNPATIEYSGLVQLRQAGFNRISIGVQSLMDTELKRIDRPHDAGDALQTINNARKAGFTNLNADLMYGLPGQTVRSWQKTLERVLEERPDHLAIYELTIEEGTPFAVQQRKGMLQLPSEDEVLEMMIITGETVATAGLSRYEISNYSRPGKKCLHNINYWKNGEYIGLGPGSVSNLSGCRYSAVADIDEYCRRIESKSDWWCEKEQLDLEARFRETVIMGLRMTDGISMPELEQRFGVHVLDYYTDILLRLKQQGLVRTSGDRFCLTLRGTVLANQVLAELV